MKYSIITIFPELFDSFLQTSLIKRALSKNFFSIDIYNLRDFSNDKHRKVDDIPYGGGAGMVMTCQPLFDAIETLQKKYPELKTRTIYLSPGGKTLTQKRAEKIARYDHLIIVCGRYEGIDQRVCEALIDEEVSIGKYVLSGGEIPAMVLIEATSRLISGVVGKNESVEFDSFSKALDGKKEYPHYTRPEVFRDLKVPEILLSGHHKNIEKWRKEKLR